MPMFGSRHTIGELRVRGAARDDAALRLAVNRDLDRCVERPNGLPPSAVLLIRQMTDPLPGVVGATNIDRRRQANWNTALRQRLDELLARARRPNERGVVFDGDAVLFGEEGEMIAALAQALTAGGSRPWWCKLLLRRFCGSGVPKLSQVLGAEVHKIPAVFDTLSAWQSLRSVAESLDETDAVQLMRALTAAYDLKQVYELIDGRESVAVLYDDAGTAEDHDTAYVDREFAPAAQNGSTAMTTRTHVAALIDLALTLQHRPAYARTKDYARRISKLWHGEIAQVSASGSQKRQSKENKREATRVDSTAVLNHTPDTESPASGDSETSDQFNPSIVAPATLSDTVNPESSMSREQISRADDAPAPLTEHSRSVGDSIIEKTGTIDRSPDESPSQPEADAIPDALPTTDWVSESIPTQWGGVLFLINLFDHLNLPACFETSWQIERHLGPWSLLELIGRALLNDDADADGLWAALAEFDGREPNAPVDSEIGAEPRPEFVLPADWISGSDTTSDILWFVEDGELRVWREDEYVLFDGAAAELRPFAQITDLLIRHRLPAAALRYGRKEEPPMTSCAGWSSCGVRPDLTRWLSLVVPYLRHRLSQASGESDVARLLRCPGRLYVDRTHVDLVAGIDAISLPARRAGLDRDPGWQPRYGRVITFHFE